MMGGDPAVRCTACTHEARIHYANGVCLTCQCPGFTTEPQP